ncbi:hypothetical protein N7520_004840 [Penicillium odoratum]|uniref:uncharacterized protein n=1 Tax=Penicillium odoratum TaxID=1167516 RepID=UPI0025491F54|nr:uncharacterized protein N7520_004840 [Penicillium odoratum]KAJ5765281.1 hypothetical protein N7520_004840 [Penicillium odoratum]
MSTFSLVALSVLILLVVVGSQKRLLAWLFSGKESLHNACSHGPSDFKRMAPYPAQPIRGRERYRVMMDVRRLDTQNWLTLDKNYMDEHRVRDNLLCEKREKVLRCLPESLVACQETLEEVSEFLCERFPGMFKKTVQGSETWVENRATKEKFNIHPGPTVNSTDALEAAVRLTMEDLSVLMMNEDGEYYLAASASLFPTGWTVDERIGWTISQMHAPVPLWHQQVASSVSKLLARLSPKSPMERSNYFVEIKRPDEDLFDILYRPGSLCEKELQDPSPNEIIIRRERQTFRRLPRTNAIVFGVKTYLTPISQLPMQELENLAKEMETWPEYVSEYKGKDVWGKKVLEYYNKRVASGESEKLCEV